MDKTVEHAPSVLVPRALTGAVVPLLLLVTDLAVGVGSLLLAVYLREQVFPALMGIEPFSPARNYLSLWPALVLLISARSLFGLYPGYGVNPAEELRRQTLSASLVAFFVLAGGTLFRFSVDYSRLVIVVTFVLVLVLLPAARALAKRLLAGLPIYGEGVWVVSQTERGEEVGKILSANRTLGLRVVGVSKVEPPPGVACSHCLVIPDGIVNFSRLLDALNARFRRVWLVPNLLDVASVWVTPRDLQGHLALELRNNLLEPANRVVKRGLELFVLLLSLPLLVPLFILLTLVVVVDTRGPVFFRQRRIGRNGRTFDILKFRTMHQGADELLRDRLANDRAAADEWRSHQKLRNDPRLTRSGALLRRLSLDELPQVLNILRGEMSLIGPRAIVEQELPLYGDKAHLYTAVLPGLTGLWQVSGRSHLSYDDRVRLDAYYVRNWSIWLDLAVLSKTPLVVLRAKGAY
jgi:exopolysaccharide biosynthesis polyprenyl glycosylphosphotransferase